MIAFAGQIAPEHCYELDSGLYFDVSTVPDYGALAGGQDDAAEGRIDPVAGKRNRQDFAIWRTSPPGENRQMEWDSPWGRGAPGRSEEHTSELQSLMRNSYSVFCLKHKHQLPI